MEFQSVFLDTLPSRKIFFIPKPWWGPNLGEVFLHIISKGFTAKKVSDIICLHLIFIMGVSSKPVAVSYLGNGKWLSLAYLLLGDNSLWRKTNFCCRIDEERNV